ncbi:hypothetical protein EYF80_057824 [Liparis tanakae]|uniref:G-protein coupled receptors family 1 profile domain-containing protein n=1 Tax=Liparis tanakae TaxID=230148 RepID=A0A4Z2ETB2_9TELE|nr:hypothetical protein EYF80_057824 [Liparis tanakae]
MNLSSGSNGSTLAYRDSYRTVVAKNLIVVCLGLIINYVNCTLIHTFRKHQSSPWSQLEPERKMNSSSSSSVGAALLNVSSAPAALLNVSSAPAAYDSFSNALTKNTVAMLVWLLLSVSNGSMVLTFLSHRRFYENPRYIMFVSMVINDALQLSLVTALYVRYVSICFPLHCGHMVTVRRTLLLIFLILFLTAAPPLTDLLVAAVHEPAGFFHTRIFCDHPLLFRHRSVYYKNCVFDGVYLSFVALTLLYTYCRIMLTASAAATGLASAQRARNTVLLHGGQVGGGA